MEVVRERRRDIRGEGSEGEKGEGSVEMKGGGGGGELEVKGEKEQRRGMLEMKQERGC